MISINRKTNGDEDGAAPAAADSPARIRSAARRHGGGLSALSLLAARNPAPSPATVTDASGGETSPRCMTGESGRQPTADPEPSTTFVVLRIYFSKGISSQRGIYPNRAWSDRPSFVAWCRALCQPLRAGAISRMHMTASERSGRKETMAHTHPDGRRFGALAPAALLLLALLLLASGAQERTSRATSSGTSWRWGAGTRPSWSSSRTSTPRACRRRTIPRTPLERAGDGGRSRSTGTRI